MNFRSTVEKYVVLTFEIDARTFLSSTSESSQVLKDWCNNGKYAAYLARLDLIKCRFDMLNI